MKIVVSICTIVIFHIYSIFILYVYNIYIIIISIQEMRFKFLSYACRVVFLLLQFTLNWIIIKHSRLQPSMETILYHLHHYLSPCILRFLMVKRSTVSSPLLKT